MDFFAQQHQAKRNTTVMVLLFMLAVAAIVLAVDFVGVVIWLTAFSDVPVKRGSSFIPGVPAFVIWGCTIVTLGVIGAGSLYRMFALSQGGTAVAKMVGARRVRPDAPDPRERRLLNVVEEMAIASGIRVPAVFVMDQEKGINAFAAGYSPNEAAVTVTRGAIDRLSRDELQGVIAHEYSHILNGDMRLNVRLLGVIAGIVLIGSIGRFLMDVGRGGNDDRNRGDIRVFLAGLALWLIGWIGVFFGQLIKAAVSRQREFLADAASVQFTRNPEGIGGALYKIGRSTGKISNRYAEELNHMYFGDSIEGAFFHLLDTHPPVEHRIERVLGERALLFLRSQQKKVEAGPEVEEDLVPEGAATALAGGGAAKVAAVTGTDWGRRAGDGTVRTTSGDVMASVGRPTMQHIDYARQVLQSIPGAVREAVGTVEGAQAALLGLLVAAEGETRERQAAMIRDGSGATISGRTLSLSDAMRPLGDRARLPVLDLALPVLKQMPQPARDRLLALIKVLIDADRRVTVSEFVLITLCRRHLAPAVAGAPPVKHRSVQTVAGEIACVISLLIHAGGGRPENFDRAMALLGLTGQSLLLSAELNFTAVEAALYELKLLAPLAKPAVIKACLAIIMADNTISITHAELMRAIGAALDTPLPPILGTFDNSPEGTKQ